jgi:hypothetical protein
MTTATTTSRACTSCHADLDHCHGVLVTHADGAVECHGDSACDDTSISRHDWRASCTDLGTCPCALPAAA